MIDNVLFDSFGAPTYGVSWIAFLRILVDFIFDGRPADDQTLKLPHPDFGRVIIVHSVDYARAYEF